MRAGGEDEHAYAHVPATIRYASNAVTVSFTWEERPDVRLDGRSGKLRLLPVRLGSVAITGSVGGTATVSDGRYDLVWRDEGDVPCPGESPVDLTEVGLETSSILHRVVRVGAEGTRRDLR